MDDKPTHNTESDLSNRKNAREPRPHSRRAFLKGIGAAGIAAPFVAIATKAAARGPKIPDVLSNTHSSRLDLSSSAQGGLRPPDQRGERRSTRQGPAIIPTMETRRPILQESQASPRALRITLLEKSIPNVYASYLAAVKTGKRADFDALADGRALCGGRSAGGPAFDLEPMTCRGIRSRHSTTLTQSRLRRADDRRRTGKR